jgi:hypothetical protein
MKRYKELVQYKSEWGSCNVPHMYSKNHQLGSWVLNQRNRSQSLPADRIAKLNKIGFVWKINKEDDWIERYNELGKYKRETGHCNVPANHKPNPQLGTWVQRQRQRLKSNSL